MQNYRYVYGPVPSRRMGLSLGVSPIPQKHCNYSCVYCQLGRTRQMTYQRKDYYPLSEIVAEAKDCLRENSQIDVVTIVGEGEPSLYSQLGNLICELKSLTEIPVAVITNGALLVQSAVREEMKNADIILPSLDAYDQNSFKIINRPHGKIDFEQIYRGLQTFSQEFEGQLWLETMIVKGLNDDEESLVKMKRLFDGLNYERLYINTPIRPPAEDWVKEPTSESLKQAIAILDGIAIELAISEGFFSEIKDDYEAVYSIIKRHPMNQHEIESFLRKRECKNQEDIFKQLSTSPYVEKITYKGYETYRGIKPIRRT